MSESVPEHARETARGLGDNEFSSGNEGLRLEMDGAGSSDTDHQQRILLWNAGALRRYVGDSEKGSRNC